MNTLDSLSRAFMKTRPDLFELSLDEFYIEHFDKLTKAECNVINGILSMYNERK